MKKTRRIPLEQMTANDLFDLEEAYTATVGHGGLYGICSETEVKIKRIKRRPKGVAARAKPRKTSRPAPKKKRTAAKRPAR